MPLQRCSSGGKSGWKWGNRGKCYVGKDAKKKALRQASAIRASGYTGNVERDKPSPRNPFKADPTRTITLRNAFVAEFRRRFRRLIRKLIDLVVVEDAFGLRPIPENPIFGVNREEPSIVNLPTSNLLSSGSRFNGSGESRTDPTYLVGNNRWRFRTDAAKIQEFGDWLQRQISEDLLPTGIEDVENAYFTAYTQQGYSKGAGRAFDQVRKPAVQASDDFYLGTKAQFLSDAFGQPETVEKVKLLAGRVFTDLKGVTETMATQLQRTLADGLVRGLGPRAIARIMTDRIQKVGIHRATLIARTEVIRAHAEGQLDSMERLGVTDVGVLVEWSTAGDDRVCPLCAELEGVVMKTKEARGTLPRHPQCRCTFIPANVGEPAKGQIRSKTAIDRAVSKSIKKEGKNKKTTTWPGADVKIAKRRPKRRVSK